MVGQLVRSDRCNDDDNDDHYKVGDVMMMVVVMMMTTMMMMVVVMVVLWCPGLQPHCKQDEKCVHLKCARPAKDIKSTKNVPRQKIDISKSAWWHVLEFDLC